MEQQSAPQPESRDESPASKGGKRIRQLKWLIRALVLALVAWGVWRTVGQAREAFSAAKFDVTQVHLGWLVLAGGLYLLGTAPCWAFWHRTLRALGQRPRWWQTLRAYYIGHLGKYVPGKALVVVLRTGLIRGPEVDTTIAATGVFVETLTYMAVGAFIAASVLMQFRQHWTLTLLAVGLMLCAGIPTLPPIFRRVVRVLRVRRANPEIEAALDGLNYRLMATGWLSMALGWILLGLSLWATLQAMPATPGLPQDLSNVAEHLPLLTACVALAMVAGFLSLVPGGLGVRELILIPLLSEPYGPAAAIVSAVLLRLVWLVAEVLFSAILYLGVSGPPIPATNPVSSPETPSSAD